MAETRIGILREGFLRLGLRRALQYVLGDAEFMGSPVQSGPPRA